MVTTENAGLIVSAIADLASGDTAKRRRARVALEQIGAPAVWPLIEVLTPRDDRTRHSALKILGAIGDSAAADTFVRGLEDESTECRWLSAEGLVALGREGLLRILGELTEYPRTERKRRGAHHVLSGLRAAGFADVTEPVLRAFLSDISQVEVPTAAREALAKLTG